MCRFLETSHVQCAYTLIHCLLSERMHWDSICSVWICLVTMNAQRAYTFAYAIADSMFNMNWSAACSVCKYLETLLDHFGYGLRHSLLRVHVHWDITWTVSLCFEPLLAQYAYAFRFCFSVRHWLICVHMHWYLAFSILSICMSLKHFLLSVNLPWDIARLVCMYFEKLLAPGAYALRFCRLCLHMDWDFACLECTCLDTLLV